LKTAILLSGGVDSSVALNLLQAEGRDTITAFYLKIWLEDDSAFMGDCPWEEDVQYVRKVCDLAGIALNILPLQAEYRERIVDFAVNELRSGRTPSPDIQCNERIKFGVFYDRIDRQFDTVATGHYAQIETQGKLRLLKRAPDPVKDQTYFLARLNQKQLLRAEFPIGHMHKTMVRAYALDHDLPTKDRKDSQGICFLGKIRFPEFVRYHLGTKQGNVVDIHTGKKLGNHNGYWYFTIGQRQGLGFHGGPWYVVKKDLQENTVFVAHADWHLNYTRSEFDVEDIHWIAEPPTKQHLQLKVRHGPGLSKCTLSPSSERRLRVEMNEPDPGIAPGQSAVFYDDDVCLGSGVICQ